MSIIKNLVQAFSFKDTVFYKNDSDLQKRYDALLKLSNEYPNNEDIKSELFIIKKGLYGENEISYQLKNANIGMYVLRDIKLKYEDSTAQIDYVLITPIFIYYIECKNIYGNITVNEKGDFIREINVNGKTIKKGMYSPLRQAETHRDIVRKIWNNSVNPITKLIASNKFDHYRKVLVVAANKETIIDTSKAPASMKYKVLRADSLVRQIKYDLDHAKGEVRWSKNDMEDIAKSYNDISIKEDVDYYSYYREKFNLKEDNLKERLLKLRKERSNTLNVPLFYIFTNDELDKILEVRPRNIDDLEKILAPVRFKTHGEVIINEINKNS